ncbi:MAG: hypothetical protein V2G42_07365 [bacterium JZ-2024 1]
MGHRREGFAGAGWVALVAGALCVGARFPYAGVNFSPDGVWKQALVLLREAGFARLRVGIAWETMEPAPGKLEFGALEALVKEARPLGLDVTGVLILENAGYAEPNRATARIQFVSALASRFRGLIDTYEIGDQVDHIEPLVAGLTATPAQVARAYALHFPALASVIRYQDPNARVLVGSFDPRNEIFFNVLRDTGVLASSDGVSLRWHLTREDMESAESWHILTTRLGAIEGALGRKEVLTVGRLTFSGERSANERAAWMARMAVTLPALGVDAFYFAPAQDIRDDLMTGLLGPTGTPRPAYTLLRNLLGVIADWRPTPAPFRFSVVFPQITPGKSGTVYYGNSVEGGIVYWNAGVQGEGYAMLSPRSYFFHQIVDPIGVTQTQVKAEQTRDGWLLKNLAGGDHPRILIVRSTDFAFLYPREEEAPIFVNLP